MAHTLQPVPKKAIAKFSEVCELHAGHDEYVSPCSHWDHCEFAHRHPYLLYPNTAKTPGLNSPQVRAFLLPLNSQST